jgi:hypothetical protein
LLLERGEDPGRIAKGEEDVVYEIEESEMEDIEQELSSYDGTADIPTKADPDTGSANGSTDLEENRNG